MNNSIHINWYFIHESTNTSEWIMIVSWHDKEVSFFFFKRKHPVYMINTLLFY